MIQLLGLTGARVREISEARWTEFDLMKQIWSLPAQRAKNNRAHEVPLSASALAILDSLPRFERCDYVFTINGRAPVNGLSRAKRRLDQAMLAQLDGAALEPFVLHDIRRSVATGLAKLGVDLHVIERCLNHVSGTFGGIVSVYQKHKFEDGMRRALDAWALHIERLVTGAETDNVVVELKARG
jgi:integrase